MTGASTGLQKALARAGSSVIAIAEMQTDDLLAQMTDEQKAALAATLAPKADASANAEMKPGDKKCSEDADDDDKGGDSDPEDKMEGKDGASANASTDRVKAVAAAVATDPNCKGKAELALAILADDDFAGLNASGLVKLLGKTPATTSASAAAGVDAEAAARAEMKAAINETGNSNIDAGNGGASAAKPNHSAGWARATARVNAQRGFK